MADIFLSYAHGDRQKAELLARALQDAGWSVWWDRGILPGSSFEQVIAHELAVAHCVVVLWSAEARESNWVRDEATMAQSRNVLVSVLTDDSDLPLGFRQQQAANITSWTGSTTDPVFQLLKQGIARLVGGSGTVSGQPINPAPAARQPSEPAQSARGSTTRITWSALAAVAAIAAVLIVAAMWSAGRRQLSSGTTPADEPVASRVADPDPSQVLVVPSNAKAILPRESLTLTVLSGKLQRLNAETRSLLLHIRFANDSTRSFDRTYYTELRLVVDGVPRAPTSAPLGQIETSSASEFDYIFEVPATAARAVLRVSRDDERSEIPLDFTAPRP